MSVFSLFRRTTFLRFYSTPRGVMVRDVIKTGNYVKALELYRGSPDLIGATAILRFFRKTNPNPNQIPLIRSTFQQLMDAKKDDLDDAKKTEMLNTTILSADVCGSPSQVVQFKQLAKKYSIRLNARSLEILAEACRKLQNVQLAQELKSLLRDPKSSTQINRKICINLMESLRSKPDEVYSILKFMKSRRYRIPTEVFLSVLARSNLQLGKLLHTEFLHDGLLAKSESCAAALIAMYGRHQAFEDMENVFQNFKNESTATPLILAYSTARQPWRVWKAFQSICEAGITPSLPVCTAAIKAVISAGSIDEGKTLHDVIVKEKGAKGQDSLTLDLIEMYGKFGEPQIAQKILDGVRRPDTHHFSATIFAWARNGRGKEALKLFERMKRAKVSPTPLTYAGVLYACCSKPYVEEGLKIYEQKLSRLLSKPKYISLTYYAIKFLAAAGKLEEAENLLNKQPGRMNTAGAKEILLACLNAKDVERGERVANILLNGKDPDLAGGAAAILAELYGAVGRSEDKEKMVTLIKDRELGRSTITLDGTPHTFSTYGDAHPQANEIQKLWQDLEPEMRLAGYQSKEMEGGDVEAKDPHSGKHNEISAILYGLLQTPPGKSLTLVKSMRMSEDCHSAVKALSKVTKRRVSICDFTGYHHFKDGVCSCQD